MEIILSDPLPCGILQKKKKKDRNELMFRTEIDLHTLKTNLCLPKVEGRDGLRVWDWHMHTMLYRIDDEWGSAL